MKRFHSSDTEGVTPQESVDKLIPILLPVAKELDCVKELQFTSNLPKETGAMQQFAIFEEA